MTPMPRANGTYGSSSPIRGACSRVSSRSVSTWARQPPTAMTEKAVIQARSTQPPVAKLPCSTIQTKALSATAISIRPVHSSHSEAGALRSCDTACSTIASRMTSPIGYASDSQKRVGARGSPDSISPCSRVNQEIANSEAASSTPSRAAPSDDRWVRWLAW